MLKNNPKLPSSVRDYLAKAGAKGGKAKTGQADLFAQDTNAPDQPVTPPKSVSAHMAKIGAAGGRTGKRWQNISPEERSEIMRRTVMARHNKNKPTPTGQG